MPLSPPHLRPMWLAALPGVRPRIPSLPQAGVLQVGAHVVWWVVVPGSVLSGVPVVAVVAAARHLVPRRRVPTALSLRVWRRDYVNTVYALSRRPGITKLDVLAPRLMPAEGNPAIARLQEEWERISHEGMVRVLTLDESENLQAGAELLERGIEVRVAHRGLGSEALTYHLSETANPKQAEAIINQHHRGADRPMRIRGPEAIRPYRNDFEREWAQARALESRIAGKILPNSDLHLLDREQVLARFWDDSRRLNLRDRSADRILQHLAFRASSKVVFLVGQPGSGKSYLRRRLYKMLRSMRIECHSLTDYNYAYRDHLRTVLYLDPSSGGGYEAYSGGAFVARDEAALLPALRAMAGDVRDAIQKYEVTLVEFARPDLITALGEFEALPCFSQVIHVSAPPELRLARIGKRASPPKLIVVPEGILIELSDNHLLPSLAERKLYAADGIDALMTSRQWRDRVFEISNGFDGDSHVDQELSRFLDLVIAPYRGLAQGLTAPGQGLATLPRSYATN
jgi:hypothetical protein